MGFGLQVSGSALFRVWDLVGLRFGVFMAIEGPGEFDLGLGGDAAVWNLEE